VSLTREDMLNELELLPVWKPRQISQPAVIEQVTEAVMASEPMPAQIIPVESLQPEPVELEASPAELTPVELTAVEPDKAEPSLLVEQNRSASIMQMDWPSLQASVSTCQACSLAQTRTQTVFGVGDPNADWLIVGEAPGAEEDRQGEPFVGQAGKLLDNMLAAIQLKRGSNVFIANVLKCRPPENRDPHGEEVVQCDPFLKRQVELIKPRLIIALGKFAAQSLLASDATVTSMRGKLHDYHGVPVIVTYHPAYLLRNLPDKAKAWEDLCLAKRTMAGLQSAEAPPSLF
jgi:DNA polymerase